MITDFHSHILPGIDDGSPSVETSMEMLRMEAAQGIRHVIATPHFYASHDNPDRFLSRRDEAFERLSQVMAGGEALPGMDVGAEVYYFSGMSDSEALSRLTIGKSRSILIEMPPPPWTAVMFRELEWICTKQGLTPVLAHIDRYISPLRTYGILRRLEELPVMVQANASFFQRKTTAAFALKLLRQNRIHVLGSDCHNCHDRPPNLGGGVEIITRRCGAGILEQIRENEEEILSY